VTRAEATAGPRHGAGARPARRHDEAGSAAVELTLLTPLLIVLLLFVVAAGRITSARLTVQDAARHAARALTLAADPRAGLAPARAAAVAAASGLPCQDLTVALTDPGTRPDGAGAPGGMNTPGDMNAPGGAAQALAVTVQVTCTVHLGDLTGLQLPARTTITATATSPRDRYRSQP
jgi:Flp pilus assembly protein TadG